MSQVVLAELLVEAAIRVDFQAADMTAAIEGLAPVLFQAHAPVADLLSFQRSALEREAQVSTCLGEHLAVPHGSLPPGAPPVAALGIQGAGLPFQGPDGKEVRFVVLLGVPEDRRDFHLQVLAAIAGGLGANLELRQGLCEVRSAAGALRLLS